jgi:BioD-like phosphotransacetylase family protein
MRAFDQAMHIEEFIYELNTVQEDMRTIIDSCGQRKLSELTPDELVIRHELKCRLRRLEVRARELGVPMPANITAAIEEI